MQTTQHNMTQPTNQPYLITIIKCLFVCNRHISNPQNTNKSSVEILSLKFIYMFSLLSRIHAEIDTNMSERSPSFDQNIFHIHVYVMTQVIPGSTKVKKEPTFKFIRR